MNPTEIVIAWNELPVYGARLIRAAVEASPNVRIRVLATRPTVPIKDVELHLGQSVIYVERAARATWREIGVPVPSVFFHTGWAYPQFNALGDEVRSAGGSVISMVDNRWKGNFRQWLGAVYFRAVLRKRFSAIWVPGGSGKTLTRILGMNAGRVVEGLYGADPEIFTAGKPLPARPQRIVFVGQYTDRKGVDVLASAWRSCAQQGWELHCFGQGPLQDELRDLPRCQVFPFLRPEQIAEALHTARFLVLPSRDDHWGLVVHEAALSGAGLLVSREVGAAQDLVSDENGRVFRANDVGDLARVLTWAQALRGEELTQLGERSLKKSEYFGPRVWAERFRQCLAIAQGSALNPQGDEGREHNASLAQTSR